MKKLKSKNINQNEELKIVKKRLSNIEKTVMTLGDKYVRIQINFSETLFSHNIFILKINLQMLHSEHSRLTSFFVTYNRNKENENSQKSPPSTMLQLGQKPTNCEELELIGYNLNGFYLVQGKQEKAGSKINIEAVYCDFSPFFKPQISNKNKESTWIHYLRFNIL